MSSFSFLVFSPGSRSRASSIVSAFLLLAVVNACTPASPRSPHGDLQSDAAKDFSALKLNEVVVLPLSSVGSAAAKVSAEQLDSFTDVLVDTLDRETSLAVLNHSAPDRVKRSVSSASGSSAPGVGGSTEAGGIRQRAVRVAGQLGAQGVFVGQIGRFDELEGSRFGGEQLAAVGFRLLLLDGASGRTLWSASYEHFDEPLSDNLFRIGETLHRGVGFRPARELLQTGFRDAARTLQKLRSAAPVADASGTNPAGLSGAGSSRAEPSHPGASAADR